MDFAKALKRICKERGTSPTAVLSAMGVSTSKIALWNNGSLPKAEMIQRLADFLDVQPSEFFMDGPAQKVVASSEAAIPENEDESEILRIYRALPRKKQHEFMVYCYGLEEQS